jgi:hypothetical protein
VRRPGHLGDMDFHGSVAEPGQARGEPGIVGRAHAFEFRLGRRR